MDQFKPFIDKMFSDNVWNTIVIFRDIQNRGHNSGITILRDYIHPELSFYAGRVTVRFEAKAGQQLQNYWGKNQYTN